MNRISWDEYFMEIVDVVSKKATCDRGRTACLIAKDKQLLVTGYVGAPQGFSHCDDVGHEIKKIINEDGSISEHCVRTVHAEQNAICNAAKLGVSINGATLYCKLQPCKTCAMLLINCGIKRIVYKNDYQKGNETEKLINKSTILCKKFVTTYK